MEKLARMLLNHLEGILNYCRTKVPMGVIEAVNGNLKALLRRGRGYREELSTLQGAALGGDQD
jgi:transposase